MILSGSFRVFDMSLHTSKSGKVFADLILRDEVALKSFVFTCPLSDDASIPIDKYSFPCFCDITFEYVFYKNSGFFVLKDVSIK